MQAFPRQLLADKNHKHEIADYCTITKNAEKYFLKVIKDNKCDGIRISMLRKGCAGNAFNVYPGKYGTNICKVDNLLFIASKNLKIFIEPKAILYLVGCKIDYEKTEIKEGLIFDTGSEFDKCGCGQSFM